MTTSMTGTRATSAAAQLGPWTQQTAVVGVWSVEKTRRAWRDA